MSACDCDCDRDSVCPSHTRRCSVRSTYANSVDFPVLCGVTNLELGVVAGAQELVARGVDDDLWAISYEITSVLYLSLSREYNGSFWPNRTQPPRALDELSEALTDP
jgi:hypothetical protein